MSLSTRLSIMMFLQFFVWGSWMVTLGTYLLQNLHFSGLEVGMIYATNSIAATVTPVLMGVLADKYFSGDRVMVVLHLLGGACLIAVYFTTSFWPFYGLMLAYNFCYVPTFSLSTSLCFYHLKNPSRDFPRIRVWGTIAWVVASVLISWLAIETEATPLLIAGIGSIVYGIYNLSLPHTPPQPGLNWASLRGDDVRSLLKDRALLTMIGALTVICIPSAYYYAFLNSFLTEVGVGNPAATMSLGQVVEIVTVLGMPWFFSNLRLRNILFIGFSVWGLRYFAFSVGRPDHFQSLIYIAIMVQGFAFAFTTLAAQLYVNSRVPPYLRSTAQGVIAFCTLGIGAFIGSWIAGAEVARHTLSPGTHDWGSIFIVPAVVGCIVALIFYLRYPKQAKI
ncbi:MAG: MFS transporter [Bacteroidota bacterium]